MFPPSNPVAAVQQVAREIGERVNAARSGTPAPPPAATAVDQCALCWEGNMDAECTCASTCLKLYCAKRYERWDGSWCPIVFSPEYVKTPAPVFRASHA